MHEGSLLPVLLPSPRRADDDVYSRYDLEQSPTFTQLPIAPTRFLPLIVPLRMKSPATAPRTTRPQTVHALAYPTATPDGKKLYTSANKKLKKLTRTRNTYAQTPTSSTQHTVSERAKQLEGCDSKHGLTVHTKRGSASMWQH